MLFEYPFRDELKRVVEMLVLNRLTLQRLAVDGAVAHSLVSAHNLKGFPLGTLDETLLTLQVLRRQEADTLSQRSFDEVSLPVSTYRVVSGDTTLAICHATLMTEEEFLGLNPDIVHKDLIVVDQAVQVRNHRELREAQHNPGYGYEDRLCPAVCQLNLLSDWKNPNVQ
jgi:hypothetical protein